PPQLSLLAVLMLRGAQTPGQLKQRAERLYAFESLPTVQEALDSLVERGLVLRHPRRPGQKEDRYEQLLGSGAAGESEQRPAEDGDPDAPTAPAGNGPAAEDRLERIERELAELREQLATLRAELGGE